VRADGAMATTVGGYSLLPGTPVTAPSSPATPATAKWVDSAPPVAVTPAEKLLARLTLSLRSTLQSR
jgi:hypothetical protein